MFVSRSDGPADDEESFSEDASADISVRSFDPNEHVVRY